MSYRIELSPPWPPGFLGRPPRMVSEPVRRFEERLCEVHGYRYCVAVSCGSAALELALLVLGCKGEAVQLPALTFAATLEAVRRVGALPVIVDVDRDTWLARWIPDLTGFRLGVSLYGLPCAGDCSVADDCEALGAEFARPVKPRISCLSFNCNKVVTCGGGGALLTDCEQYAAEARARTTHNKDRRFGVWYSHAGGWNYRMHEDAACRGLEQIETLRERISRRAEIQGDYRARLGAVLRFQHDWSPAGTSNHWLTAGTARDARMALRILNALDDEGIEARPVFLPLWRQGEGMQGCLWARGGDAAADEIAVCGVCLPTHPGLTDAEMKEVCAIVQQAAGEQL